MRTIRAFGSAVVLASVWCALSAGPALALHVTYAYVGTVTSMVEDPAGVSGVQEGDAFRFTFTFDTSAVVDHNPLPDVADYEALVSAATTFTRSSVDMFTVGPPLASSHILEVLNDRHIGSSTLDGFNVTTTSSVDSGGGNYVDTTTYISLGSANLAVFSSTDLSELGVLAPDPALFDLHRVFMFQQRIYSPTLIGYVEIHGVVTGIAEPWAVPESSTFLLLAIGLVGLGVTAWRRDRRK